ncbi:BamA/OMP85 family outer membrane protein [Rosettibacter firmus]|uniref:BamA/OMP85 family outer membrane protein n=1 Tax=Rosettibacter firmus TaxID=3111522 RepID=UPI00336BE974
MNKALIILSIFFTSILFAQKEEGIELKKIEFIGNNTFSAAELSNVIISKESPSWIFKFLNKFTSIGKPPSYFDSLLIYSDISALKQYYLSHGFFKVKIKANYFITNNNNSASLIFKIDEGDRARFHSLTMKGLDVIPAEFQHNLFNMIKIDTNKFYEDDLVINYKNTVINFLRDNGYMLAVSDNPDIIVDTIKNIVDVQINFYPGKRYKISNVLTSRTGTGKDLVDDELLKEIVGIKPGQYYSNYNIQRGQIRLYRTELFTSSVINSIISDTVGNTVPIIISADIGMLHELSPELIVNNEDNTFNLGLGISFIKKNFFGDARKFRVSSSAAAQNVSELLNNFSFTDSTIFGYGDARISIEQPFLFGRPINTKLESYITAQKRKLEYNSLLYGAKLGFDFELPIHTYFNSLNTYINVERAEYTYKDKYLISLLTHYYQRYNFSQKDADSISRNLVYNVLGGELPTASTNAILGISLGANKTNDIFSPTRGYSISLLLEEANSIPYLFSKIINSEFTRPLYFKTLLTFTNYFPVYNSSMNSLGMKFKIGQIFTYRGDKSNIPLNQRFYAGGSNSVRGWNTRQLVPQQELMPIENINQISLEDLEAILEKGAPTGGFFLIEGSIETRNRLFGNIGSVMFIDYGNTWNDYKIAKLNEIALAGGVGLRYYSDFAPIRIDFGIKLYDPKDKRTLFSKKFFKDLLQFHIGIGEAF